MPVTGQGLKHVMPGDGTDSKECDQAKSEANTREGHGGQAIEKSEGSIWGHKYYKYSNYNSSRHTQELTLQQIRIIISSFYHVACVITALPVDRSK